jgi:hypothetical protein
VASDGYRYLIELERRFAEEFGEQEYEVVRDVLARLVGVLDRFAAEEVSSRAREAEVDPPVRPRAEARSGSRRSGRGRR